MELLSAWVSMWIHVSEPLNHVLSTTSRRLPSRQVPSPWKYGILNCPDILMWIKSLPDVGTGKHLIHYNHVFIFSTIFFLITCLDPMWRNFWKCHTGVSTSELNIKLYTLWYKYLQSVCQIARVTVQFLSWIWNLGLWGQRKKAEQTSHVWWQHNMAQKFSPLLLSMGFPSWPESSW